MHQVTFLISAQPPGCTFQLWLHVSDLWTSCQKNAPWIFDMLCIDKFWWNLPSCIARTLKSSNEWTPAYFLPFVCLTARLSLQWMNEWNCFSELFEETNKQMNGWTDEWMNEQMNEWISGFCECGCSYICLCAHVSMALPVIMHVCDDICCLSMRMDCSSGSLCVLVAWLILLTSRICHIISKYDD